MTTTTECTGSWTGFPRYLETETDNMITVFRCTGCAELLVIHRCNRIPVPPAATDREIYAAVIEHITQRATTQATA